MNQSKIKPEMESWKKGLDKMKRRVRKDGIWLFVALLIAVGGVVMTVPVARSFIKDFGPGLSPAEVEQRINRYVEQTVPGAESPVVSVEKVENEALYKLELKIGERPYTSYATKDGKFLFPSGINLEDFMASMKEKGEGDEGEGDEGEGSQPQGSVPQRERPDVKLFVMSYCPYGLQSEKGFLPAWRLLREKAEMGVYFVDYAMHEKKEIDENLKQYCIQKEQPDRFIPYLECFVKEGKGEQCLRTAGVSKTQLSSCEQRTDREFDITADYEDKGEWVNGRFPPFNVHQSLNEKYGVGGSPTLVVNDTIVRPEDRSADAFKTIVCSAFETPPAECEMKLSTAVPQRGFGGGAAAGASTGSCQ